VPLTFRLSTTNTKQDRPLVDLFTGPLKLTLDQPIGLSGPLSGGPMPDDLRGIEEGEGTFLNARSFKFAGFLNRVKETVGRVWTQKVIDASGKRDPTGQLYSYKDRRTVIEFTLDRQGEITDVHVAASSGVPLSKWGTNMRLNRIVAPILGPA